MCGGIRLSGESGFSTALLLVWTIAYYDELNAPAVIGAEALKGFIFRFDGMYNLASRLPDSWSNNSYVLGLMIIIDADAAFAKARNLDTREIL